MLIRQYKLSTFLFFLLAIFTVQIYAQNTGHNNDQITGVSDILELEKAPAGVVFEIISGDKRELEKRLPAMQEDITALRNKFSGLPIALVTHGQEQFSLLSKNQSSHSKTHTLTSQLVENNVDVHVCGTHASWYSYTDEDFPSFVDVAAAAPAQINDYIELGYIHIEY